MLPSFFNDATPELSPFLFSTLKSPFVVYFLISVRSSIAIILLRKKVSDTCIVALLCFGFLLSRDYCVLCLFLAVPWVGTREVCKHGIKISRSYLLAFFKVIAELNMLNLSM